MRIYSLTYRMIFAWLTTFRMDEEPIAFYNIYSYIIINVTTWNPPKEQIPYPLWYPKR